MPAQYEKPKFKKVAPTSLAARLAKGQVIICAEGYIFELERRGYVQAGSFVPEVVLEHPEVVQQLHTEFLRAGTEVLPALTYYGHREKLKLIGREQDLELLNRQAIRIAHAAAGTADVLVAGNICNTWAYRHDDEVAAAEVKRQYTEQVGWASDEGVDFILAETLEYVGEALIALEVIHSFGLAAVINFAPFGERSRDGYEWVDACLLLQKKGAEVVGFNCARGPHTLLPLARTLQKKAVGPTSLVPVPYRTTQLAPSFLSLTREDGTSAYTLGLDAYLIDRHDAATFATQATALGVAFIGLCCGAGPQHIRAVAEALGRHPEASKYSADFSKHGLVGSKEASREHEKPFLALQNDAPV